MKLFEKELKNYVKYHTREVPPNTLDPRIWFFPPEGGDPKLLPGIKAQILRNIDQINDAEQQYVKTRVWDYFLVGPIVKEGSSKKCSINVIVQINTTNLEDLLKERILNTIKELNGKLAVGTLHPIYYIPTIRKINIDQYNAVYHPYTEQWLKKPRFLGEAKNSLDELTKDPSKQKPKQSLKKGLKKIATI
jgi:hypothetical protein